MVCRSHIHPISPLSRNMVAEVRSVQGSFHYRVYAGKQSYTLFWKSSGASRKNDEAARVIRKRIMLSLRM